MKLRGIAALFLTLALLPLPAAHASQAIGSEVHEYVQVLGPGTQLHTGQLWSATYSDLRTERYLTFAPNADVTPTVAIGASVQSKQSIVTMAKGLEADGKRVLGGVNGDYYVVATGVPLGLVVQDGVLRSSASYHHAVGFLPDGSTIVGMPQLSLYTFMLGSRYGIGALNKTRTVELGLHLFTADFGPDTQNSQPGIDVILTPLAQQPDDEPDVSYDTQLRIGKRVVCTVEAVLHSQREVAIAQGSFVLSINAKCDPELLAQMEAIAVGDTMTLGIDTADERWCEAVSAVGAFRRLVTDGVAEQGLDQAQQPRTAVGVKPDGSAVFYTIDGRQPGYSVGASMAQVAARLVELGCTDAVLLDGGGSTTLGATAVTETAFSMKNRSSDGSARAVSNAIFLVSNLQPSGTLGSLALLPDNGLLLAGARLALRTHAIDTAYYPMYHATGAQFTADIGTVDEGGVLTAPSARGIMTVTAAIGAAEGVGTFTVVDTPDRIALSSGGESVAAVNVDPGAVLDLDVSAMYRNLPLVAQDDCFVWTVSPEVGTVDQNGVFTAGSRGGSGSLTVTAGERSFSIPVSVAGHVIALEQFEAGMGGVELIGTMDAALETRPAYVRFGRQSLRLDYNAAADGLAMIFARYPLPAGEEYLGMWVYGDGSGSALSAMFLDARGELLQGELAMLDSEGWQHVMIPIPDGAVALDRLAIWQAQGDDGLGTVWVDQLILANQYVIDLDPPNVTAKVSGLSLTATVRDAVDKKLVKSQISVRYDGWLLDFDWNADNGTLTAQLPAGSSELLHRVTVIAADRSGNLGRASVDILPAPPQTGDGGDEIPYTGPFADAGEHWAHAYTTYLFYQGVSQGYVDGETRLFRPDAEITRGEFFVMVARFLRVDTALYDHVELPFVDCAAIPQWALPGMRAMYAMGLVQGSGEADGLHALAEKSLTRAEAMTILDRIQPRGYPGAALEFADAPLVPEWAVPAMETLVAQGVVSGYDGMLHPMNPVRRGEVAKLLYTMQ